MTLIGHLEYLKTQTLCDLDRRDKFQDIRSAWESLQREAFKIKAFEKFKADQSFWNPLEVFVGAATPYFHKPPPATKPSDPYEKWDASNLLRHLEDQASQKPVLEHMEWIALRVGLMYLHSQAQLPRMSQDKNRKGIQFVYEAIRPLLIKSKLLDPFRKHQNLQRRWKAFIIGSIV
jgi:hypothetical protein